MIKPRPILTSDLFDQALSNASLKEEEEAFEGTEIKFESVDQIVISQLETIESSLVDTGKLIELYRDIII